MAMIAWCRGAGFALPPSVSPHALARVAAAAVPATGAHLACADGPAVTGDAALRTLAGRRRDPGGGRGNLVRLKPFDLERRALGADLGRPAALERVLPDRLELARCRVPHRHGQREAVGGRHGC